MSVSTHGRDLAIAACAIACAASTSAFGQSLIWQNYWTESAPALAVAFSSRSAIAPDGDAIIASVSVTRNDYYLARFSPAGAVRWSTHFGPGNQDLDPVTALLPLADGSTYVGFDTPGVGYVGKFSEAGAALWMRNLPANFIVDAPQGSVVVGGCSSASPHTVVVAKLDATSGKVLWDFEAPDHGSSLCTLMGLRVDDDGEVYLAISDPSSASGAVTTVSRLDGTGHVVWASVLDSTWAPIGLGQDTLVIHGAGTRSLARSDGSTRWSVAQGAIDGVMAPGSNDPILLGASQVSRLDGATGAVEWSTNLSESYQAIIVAGGSIVLTGGTNVASVDATAGSIAWSHALASPYSSDGYAPYIVSSGAVGNTLQSIAYAHAFSDTEFWLQAIDLQSGSVAASVVPSPVERGANDGNSHEASGDRFGVAAFAGPEGSALRVRRLGGVDGTPAWDVSETVSLEPQVMFPGYPYRPSSPGLSVDANAVAVTAAENLTDGYYYTNTFGAAWAGAYDRSTGARRWTTVVQDPFQLFTYSATPAVMSNEDVVFAFGASYEPYFEPPAHTQYSVMRLDAGDGHLLWRHDVALPAGSYGAFAPTVTRVGTDDLLVAAPLPLEFGTATLVRIAGGDGTRLWSSTVLAPDGVYEIHAQSDGAIIVRGSKRWARLDASNGAVLWSSTESADPACPPDNLCYTGSSVAIKNGDLLASGRSGFVPVVVRLHGDGSGAEDFWYLGSPADGTRAVAGQIALDAQGTPWVRISRIFNDARYGVEFVGALDLNAGTLPMQQAIGTYMGDGLMQTRTGSLLDDGSVGTRLPISVFEWTHDGAATLGDGAIDLAVTASGDLAVQVQTDRSHVALGGSVAFRISVHYVGDAPIDGVQLLAFMPWSSGFDDVHCTVTPAAACELSTASGNIVSTFPMQPGGDVVIMGSLKALGWPVTPRKFEAVVVGPTGLAEPNTQNNFAGAAITQSLFFDGFER